MSTQKLSNVSIAQFEAFLELAQCKFIHTKGGHHKWTRSDLNRPLVYQSHINPIPEFIVKNLLRLMKYSKNDFFDILDCKKTVAKAGVRYTITAA
jgi:hypothetical protein